MRCEMPSGCGSWWVHKPKGWLGRPQQQVSPFKSMCLIGGFSRNPGDE